MDQVWNCDEKIGPGKTEREISFKLMQRAFCFVCVRINLNELWYAFNWEVEVLFVNFRLLLSRRRETMTLLCTFPCLELWTTDCAEKHIT
jgi:hypothetical protein